MIRLPQAQSCGRLAFGDCECTGEAAVDGGAAEFLPLLGPISVTLPLPPPPPPPPPPTWVINVSENCLVKRLSLIPPPLTLPLRLLAVPSPLPPPPVAAERKYFSRMFRRVDFKR